MLGYDRISDITKDPSAADFTEKTKTIRDVLKQHYIASVEQSYVAFTQNVSPPLINTIQEIEKQIKACVDSVYRGIREKVIKLEIDWKYDEQGQVNQERLKRYRVIMEQIEKIKNEIDFTRLSET